MSVGAQRDQHTSAFADGVRAGIPFAVAAGLLSISFGVVAQEAGLSGVATIVMSAIVFAGSAQFAASRSSPRAERWAPPWPPLRS